MKQETIFTPEFLKEIGFKRVYEYETLIDFKTLKYQTRKVKEPYGRAHCIRDNGMTVLQWNINGPNCTYFGDPLEEGAISFGIGKDGGSRHDFSGYIWTQDDIRHILKLTW